MWNDFTYAVEKKNNRKLVHFTLERTPFNCRVKIYSVALFCK